MKKNFFILLMISVFGIVNLYSQNTQTIMRSNNSETVITFNLTDYSFQQVQTPHGTEATISAPETAPSLLKGAPDLSKMTASIIIPDRGNTKIEVVSSNYKEYDNISIAPSKGSFTRDIDPSTVPYTYGKYYKTNDFFPGRLADTDKPFILRDHRGQTVSVYPFQYNPVTKKLRVYSDITVKVSYTNNKGENELVNNTRNGKVSYEFNQIYKNLFLNYEQTNSRYTPVEEEGKMLIVCHDDFMDEMADFVEWKNISGRPTTMVGTSVAGTTASAIKTYVQNYYNTEGLTFLLLIGDAEQVPPLSGGGLEGDSDNGFAYVTGDDRYMEFFVGRFSAETGDQVTTQVNKAILYEKGTDLEDGWLNKPTGIASNEGAGSGDDGEADWQHMRVILNKLDAFTYNKPFNEYFDGSHGEDDAAGNPSASDVAAGVNAGTGIICYIGHGGDNSWVTSGFSSDNANALTNTNKLPFIWSVACVNGNFKGQTCFAEAWARAKNGDNLTGSVGFYGSTINQPWKPPMIAQDEMIDLLVGISTSGGTKRTYGGLSTNGCFQMVEELNSGANATIDTWVCFGDPSLSVRTDNPTVLNITCDDQIIFGASEYVVTCAENGALATLSVDGVLKASAKVTGGQAAIPLAGIDVGDNVKLVVTAFNKKYVEKNLTVIAPSGPYVSVVSYSIVDGSDSINYNSTEKLKLTFKNLGVDNATSAKATVSTEDSFITLSNNTDIDLGDMNADATKVIENVQIQTDANIPDLHLVTLKVDITSGSETWTKNIVLTVKSPELSGKFSSTNDDASSIAFTSSPVVKVALNSSYQYDVKISEIGGNGNGNIDPGEKVVLTFNTLNIGHAAINNVTATLTTTSNKITINNPVAQISNIEVGDTANSAFSIEVASDAVIGTTADFKLIIAKDSYKDTVNISLPIGLIYEDFETGDLTKYNWVSNGWTVTDTDKHEGVYSAQSNSPGHNNSNTLTIQLNNVTADNKMSFFYRVSTEASYDKFIVSVNGTEILSKDGVVAWTSYEYTFATAGDYTIKFEYKKDVMMDGNDDNVWLDYIIFPVAPSKGRGAKSITITAPTLPDWLSLTDNGDGTGTLSGTSPNAEQSDAVVLSATNGTSTVKQEFSVITGILYVNEVEHKISYYPNPTSDVLNINFDKSEKANLTISDVSGKIYVKQELNDAQNEVNLRDLPAGIYILNIEVNGSVYNHKVIKK